MKVGLLIGISKSLMLARWKQTLVAAIGVTFSITMFIALLGFMSGLNTLLDGLIINRTPHVRLYNDIKPNEVQPIQLANEFRDHYNFISSIKPRNELLSIDNNLAIIASIKNDNRVLGIAPKISAQVFYNVGSIDLTGVVNGIDVEAENRLFMFDDYVVEGNYLDLKP